VRADDEVPKRIRMNPRQPDEHARIADVVFLQVVRVRLILDERVAGGDIHHHDERVRLGRLVGRHAHEHPATDLERRLAPRGRELDVRQRAADRLDRLETVAAGHGLSPDSSDDVPV
jgi:hypothetical protein